MKNISKKAALLAAVLMIFCITGCGDNAGGTPTPTPTPAEPQFVAQETPLTLEAIAAGEITLTNPWSTLKYMKNGGDFVSVTASANTIAVAAGDKVEFYADGSENTYSTYLKIECSADCYVYGNVMSLLSSSDFKNDTSIPDTTEYTFAGLFSGNTHIKNHATKNLVLPATELADGCYNSMFEGCTGLTSAPELPATTLTYFCYENMFQGCTGLTSAPALPAETLEEWCYASMFRGCTGLTNAPELPATSMWDACYDSMFRGCTGLTIAPTLPATELVAGCYSNMFNGCSSLNSVTCLATYISTASCTSSWLDGVASTGTFKKAASMDDWTTNSVSGIPTGWTVQNYTAH